ncbi:MAG: FecR domain-containing protein [Phycisphaeraceae bacterium]
MSQPDNTPNHDALTELFWDYLHGRLDAEAAAKLEQHLLTNAQAAADCKDLVDTMVLAQEAFKSEGAAINELKHLTGPDLLKELARREQLAEPQLVDLSADVSSVDIKLQDHTEPLTFKQIASATAYLLSPYKKRVLAFGSLAAALVLAVILLSNLVGPSANPIANNNTPTEFIEPEAPTESTTRGSAVATITATHNAVWSSASAGEALASPVIFTPGTNLHPGDRLTLTVGFAEITTNDGAIAILEAPATVELLDNDNAIRLHAGKLIGICETESSKGFLVQSPGLDVTDLGTRFAVDATSPVCTEVHVLQGEVEVELQSADGSASSAPYRVVERQAVRHTHGSKQVSATEFTSQIFRSAYQSYTLRGTGLAIAEGKPDPHWQIVADGSGPLEKPIALHVQLSTHPHHPSPGNDPERAQYLLFIPGDQLQGYPVDTGITDPSRLVISTTIDLPESVRLDAGDLYMEYASANVLHALTINGQTVEPLSKRVNRGELLGTKNTALIPIPSSALRHGENIVEVEIRNARETLFQWYIHWELRYEVLGFETQLKSL